MKCPHCLVAFHTKWHNWTRGSNTQHSDRGTHFRLLDTNCPECGKLTLVMETRVFFPDPIAWQRTMIYPKTTARPLSPEVPQAFARDFQEACLVLADSEKASAALSRRCLQHLLQEKAGVKGNNLANQIQQVIDLGQLPSHLTDAIDAVRNFGNFAAHPIKSTNTGEIIEVELGEAEWLLDTLEFLFDFYCVQPAKLAKRRAELNKKLKDAGKPEMKGQTP